MGYGRWDDLDREEQDVVGLIISESLARRRHEDYDNVVSGVRDKLGTDDEFRQNVFGAGDPGEALYKAGVEHQAEAFDNEPLEDIMALPVEGFARK